MQTKILAALREANDYLSGEALSEQFGITRSAVWKHITKLKSEGYVIDSIRNRGYKLLSAPDILDADTISKALADNAIAHPLITLKITDSTNEEAKRLARQNAAPHGLVVTAEEQTAGKGRLGRQWCAGHDGGMYFSLLLRPDLPPSDIASITLAAGYAVCLAIRQFTDLPAKIKWPNDIIIGNKKLCGILTEMAAQSDKVDYVIIGIGINVNNTSFPEAIASKATSLALEAGHTWNKNDLLICVLRFLEQVLSRFFVSLSIEDVAHFNRLCATIGRKVTVERGGQQIMGVARTVSASGELIIRTDEGRELTVSSGEVTVQGIY